MRFKFNPTEVIKVQINAVEVDLAFRDSNNV